MKVSTRTRYGIRAAIELAVDQSKGPLQLRVIAERQDISVKYLEQLMAILRSSGIVRSVRGARGGYVLARPAKDIKMLDLFQALEGPVLTTECVDSEDACERSGDCAARQLWMEVEGAAQKVLGSISLQDLVDRTGGVRQRDYQI